MREGGAVRRRAEHRLERRTPLRARSRLLRTRPDQPPASMRLAVLHRDDYRCACCGEQLDLHRWECHHRLLRSQGGRHELANLIALIPGHHARAHSRRRWAEQGGLIVPSWADPAQVPVRRHELAWSQPAALWTPADPQPWQVAA